MRLPSYPEDAGEPDVGLACVFAGRIATIAAVRIDRRSNLRDNEVGLRVEHVTRAVDDERLMSVRFVLTDYLEGTLAQAEFEKLPDGGFAARIPACPGVVAFARTRKKCEEELRSTLEDWVLIGLRLGHALPVIDGIDLNKSLQDAPVESL